MPELAVSGRGYFFPKDSFGTRIIALSGIKAVCERLRLPELDMNDCWRIRAGVPPRALTLRQNYDLRRALRGWIKRVECGHCGFSVVYERGVLVHTSTRSAYCNPPGQEIAYIREAA